MYLSCSEMIKGPIDDAKQGTVHPELLGHRGPTSLWGKLYPRWPEVCMGTVLPPNNNHPKYRQNADFIWKSLYSEVFFDT